MEDALSNGQVNDGSSELRNHENYVTKVEEGIMLHLSKLVILSSTEISDAMHLSPKELEDNLIKFGLAISNALKILEFDTEKIDQLFGDSAEPKGIKKMFIEIDNVLYKIDPGKLLSYMTITFASETPWRFTTSNIYRETLDISVVETIYYNYLATCCFLKYGKVDCKLIENEDGLYLQFLEERGKEKSKTTNRNKGERRMFSNFISNFREGFEGSGIIHSRYNSRRGLDTLLIVKESLRKNSKNARNLDLEWFD